MLPVAVGSGAADGSFRSPMAVAVIGGLVTSTLLSLLVVPAVFTMVDDLSILFARLVGRKVQDERAHERDPNALSASHPA